MLPHITRRERQWKDAVEMMNRQKVDGRGTWEKRDRCYIYTRTDLH